MFLYDKTNILEGVGIFEIDFAPSHEPANMLSVIMPWPIKLCIREKHQSL